MRYELILIVLIIVLNSIKNCLALKESKHFRRNSNSTTLKNNSKFNLRKVELFKLKKLLKKFGNQGTAPPYLSTNAGASGTTAPPLSTGAVSTGSTAATTTVGGRLPHRRGRPRGRRGRKRRRGKRRRRKNKKNNVMFGRLELVLNRQRFQQFYRSSIRAGHRTRINKRHRSGLRRNNNRRIAASRRLINNRETKSRIKQVH